MTQISRREWKLVEAPLHVRDLQGQQTQHAAKGENNPSGGWPPFASSIENGTVSDSRRCSEQTARREPNE